MNTLDRLHDTISAALASARMENASFGFPDDRVEVKAIHGGRSMSSDIAAGQVLHPDEYIKRTVRLYHGSWIITPLEQALQMVEQNRQLLAELDRVRKELARTNIQALVDLSRAGMKED